MPDMTGYVDMANNGITVTENEWNKLVEEAAMFRSLQSIGRIGWWQVNFNKRTFTCSQALADMYGFSTLPVSFEAFRALIHPDHRERVIRNFTLYPEIGIYDEIFPVKTGMGYAWINSRLGAKEYDAEGNLFAQGVMQQLNDSQVPALQADSLQTDLRELMNNHNRLSRTLLSLLKNPDTADVITETLRNLLEQFDGDRAYIFEYDFAAKIQNNTYEVTKPGITPQIDLLHELPLDVTRWWTEQLTHQNPIMLDSLDMLPPQANDEKQVLQMQDIKSIIAVPLISQNGTWGYMGIDIVGRFRRWSDTDKQWLFSIANILSVCMELKRSETTVRNEKEYFRNLYRNMPMGFARLRVIYGSDGRPADYRFVEVNPAFENVTGLSHGHTIGKSVTATIDIQRLLHDLESVVISGGSYNRQAVPIKGRYFNFTLFAADGNYCTILFTDVTRTIEAYKELEYNKELLQNIFDNIPVGVEVYDRHGNLIDLNKANLQIFGLKNKEQAIGRNLFANPNIRDEYKEAFRRREHFEFSLDYDFSRIKHTGYYESEYNDGIKKLLTRNAMLFDEKGELENYLLIIVDNTESISTFHKLHDFETLFNYIAEFAKIGFCQFNFGNEVFTASEQWFKNVHYTGTQPARFEEVYVNTHPEDFVPLKRFFTDAKSRRASSFRGEIRVKGSEGKWKWIRCNYKVQEPDEEQDGTLSSVKILGLNIDITELKQTEIDLRKAKMKAEESDRLKSSFLANMSHEIRTPLNAIIGFSNLLANNCASDENAQYISIIQKNNELLLQLVSDILDLSKIEAGIVELAEERIEVNEFCTDLVNEFMYGQRRKVPILFEPHCEKCCIYSDRQKITQIMYNLLGNAVKFTRQGTIRIGYVPYKNEIEFFVQDTGIGIEPDKIPAIFERFTKLDSFSQGTGLGLSICKSLVEKLGGTIRVESEVGKGSRFWFTVKTPPIDCMEIHGGGN